MNQSSRVSPFSFIICLVVCLGISTLWVSPTFAQIASPGPVNGAGPSPASTFTNVFNLPTDVFTGGTGVPTQVNVNSGGPFPAGPNAFTLGLNEELNLNGGSLTNGLFAAIGSEVNVIGGDAGDDFVAFGSVVSISGGTIGNDFSATLDTEVNVSGGSIGTDFQAIDTSILNISGGSIGDNFVADGGATVNFLGTEFFLDGVPVSTTFNQAVTITARDVELSGVLADGQSFSFDLNQSLVAAVLNGEDFFSTGATVTVTVLEPSSAALATLGLAMMGFRRRRR